MSWTNEAKTFSKAFFDGFKDVLFPSKCVLCFEVGRPPICTDCAPSLNPLRAGSCERCGIDDAGDNQVCSWMSAVDVMRGAFDYRGAAGLAVKQLKFSRAVEAAAPMAAHLRRVGQELGFDYAVPVPIHWSRMSHRGFNQAELLAKHSGIVTRNDLLRRTRATWPQARSRAADRRSALEGAFASKACKGARILLIDDVIT